MALNKYDDSDNAEGEITTFLKDYGSYLRMDTCLAYASVLRATFVIDLLLSIAKHDPRHREAMKQMSKSTSMVFYESVSEKIRICHLFLFLRKLTFGLHNSKKVYDVGDIAAASKYYEGEIIRQEASNN